MVLDHQEVAPSIDIIRIWMTFRLLVEVIIPAVVLPQRHLALHTIITPCLSDIALDTRLTV